MAQSSAGAAIRILGAIAIAFALCWWTLPAGAPGAALALSGFDLLDWPLDGRIEPFNREARFASALGAGFLCSFGVFLFLLVAPLIERGERLARRGAIAAILSWFCLDSTASIAAGVAPNAVFNVAFAIIYLAPLLLVRFEPAGHSRNESA